MKSLRVLPLICQFTLFLLVVFLLWNRPPSPGADGLVQVEVQDYVSEIYGVFIRRGDNFDIHQSESPYETIVQDAQFVSLNDNRVPSWLLTVYDYTPWLHDKLPKRWRGAGHTFVVRIKPSDWIVLDEAKRQGKEFCLILVPKRFVGTGRRR